MKALMLGVVVLAVLGGVVFAGIKGIVNVPGLSPSKKKASADALYNTDKKEEVVAKKETPKPTPPRPKPTPAPKAKPDLAKGRKKIAKLWDQLEAAQLAKIMADWRDDEAAKILVLMDSGKVSRLLSTVDAKKASTLSREIQKEASMPDETKPL